MAKGNCGSLCWRCRKACAGLGCCWVDEKPSGTVPVPGWQAAEHESVQYGGRGIIYTVQACPQFEEG